MAKMKEVLVRIKQYFTKLENDKVDKVVNGTENNIVLLDANGNIKDSGKSLADTGKIDSVSIDGTTVQPDANKNVDLPAYPTRVSLLINNVDNTSDANKPVSTAQQTAIDSTGHKINLEIDNTTFKLKAKLYDKNNTLLSTSDEIDLPLESVVVGGSYEPVTKQVILTLQNGTTIAFSVADLIYGLQSQITAQNPLSSDLVDDTNAIHKFVIAEEKQKIAKLNIIELSGNSGTLTQTQYDSLNERTIIKINNKIYVYYSGSASNGFTFRNIYCYDDSVLVANYIDIGSNKNWSEDNYQYNLTNAFMDNGDELEFEEKLIKVLEDGTRQTGDSGDPDIDTVYGAYGVKCVNADTEDEVKIKYPFNKQAGTYTFATTDGFEIGEYEGEKSRIIYNHDSAGGFTYDTQWGNVDENTGWRHAIEFSPEENRLSISTDQDDNWLNLDMNLYDANIYIEDELQFDGAVTFNSLDNIFINDVQKPLEDVLDNLPANIYEKTTRNTFENVNWSEKILGNDVWTDGTNVYYSNGNDNQYVFNKETKTWSQKNWNNISANIFYGIDVWTDGTDIYYSRTTTQKILNKETDTWEDISFNVSIFKGEFIWTDGTNVYYSNGNDNQYVFNKETKTWSQKNWTGIQSSYSFTGNYVWTDGENIYFSYSTKQLYLVPGTNNWLSKTWSGLTTFNGDNIWKDGEQIYCSKDGITYILDKRTSTWSVFTINNLTIEDAHNIWSDGDETYYSDSSSFTQKILITKIISHKTDYLHKVAETGSISDLEDANPTDLMDIEETFSSTPTGHQLPDSDQSNLTAEQIATIRSNMLYWIKKGYVDWDNEIIRIKNYRITQNQIELCVDSLRFSALDPQLLVTQGMYIQVRVNNNYVIQWLEF